MNSTAAPVQVQAAGREPGRIQATILVIEDERFVRDVTCETLRNAGYRVLQADSAAGARKLFLAYGKRIHLLLCDVVLPDSSGVLLAQALRRLSPGLRVILASGYPRCVFAEVFNQEAKTEFLTKPYSAASLISKVQQLLRKEGSLKQPTHIRGR